MLLYTLIDIISYLIQIIQVVVIVQFVMYLLITFNVINMHNNFVESVWRALNAILDPILNPIRRIMPNTGGIDFSPMVLIIGLVQSGELDPTTVDAWIAKTHTVKPELDKEVMGAIFIKYKGAEAGEVDWRPTETVPEDYYAL